MSPPSLKDKPDGILKQFREQLQLQDLIHEGDTIGTDDAILLYAWLLCALLDLTFLP